MLTGQSIKPLCQNPDRHSLGSLSSTTAFYHRKRKQVLNHNTFSSWDFHGNRLCQDRDASKSSWQVTFNTVIVRGNRHHFWLFEKSCFDVILSCIGMKPLMPHSRDLIATDKIMHELQRRVSYCCRESQFSIVKKYSCPFEARVGHKSVLWFSYNTPHYIPMSAEVKYSAKPYLTFLQASKNS